MPIFLSHHDATLPPWLQLGQPPCKHPAPLLQQCCCTRPPPMLGGGGRTMRARSRGSRRPSGRGRKQWRQIQRRAAATQRRCEGARVRAMGGCSPGGNPGGGITSASHNISAALSASKQVPAQSGSGADRQRGARENGAGDAPPPPPQGKTAPAWGPHRAMAERAWPQEARGKEGRGPPSPPGGASSPDT